MTNDSQLEQVYVALPDESVDVWRPVSALRLRDSVFRIVTQPYDPSIERWEFEPGAEVVCEYLDTRSGKILAARRRA